MTCQWLLAQSLSVKCWTPLPMPANPRLSLPSYLGFRTLSKLLRLRNTD